jgi:hypothetical protein
MAMRALAVVVVMAGAAQGQPTGVATQATRPGQFELSLAPAAVQVNGKFAQHVGSFGTFTWHATERFALQLVGGGNWYNEESGFNEELVGKFRVEAQTASSLLWTWGLFGGTEVEPVFGELSLLGGPHVRLGVVLSVGLGAGGTRHLLKPRTLTSAGLESDATYADTGVRFMATVAAGLRVRVGERFTARLEVRDVGYSAAVSSVNGCSGADVDGLVRRTHLSDLGSVPVSGTCRGFSSPSDARTAQVLFRVSSGDVLHSLSLSLSAGFSF